MVLTLGLISHCNNIDLNTVAIYNKISINIFVIYSEININILSILKRLGEFSLIIWDLTPASVTSIKCNLNLFEHFLYYNTVLTIYILNFADYSCIITQPLVKWLYNVSIYLVFTYFLFIECIKNTFGCVINSGFIKKLLEIIFGVPNHVPELPPIFVLVYVIPIKTAVWFIIQEFSNLYIGYMLFVIRIKLSTWFIIQKIFIYLAENSLYDILNKSILNKKILDLSELGDKASGTLYTVVEIPELPKAPETTEDHSLIDWLITIIKFLIAHLIHTDAYWELIRYLDRQLTWLMHHYHYGPRDKRLQLRLAHFLIHVLLSIGAHIYIFKQYALILWKLICFIKNSYISFFDLDKPVRVTSASKTAWSTLPDRPAKMGWPTMPEWPTKLAGHIKAIKVD